MEKLDKRSGIRKNLARTGVHATAAIAVSMMFLLPGYLFQFIGEKPILWFSFKYLWIFATFGAVLAACRSFKWILFTFIFLGLLELTQFGSLYYSGDFLTPYSVEFMLLEFKEIITFTRFNIAHVFYAPMVVLAPYALGVFVLWRSSRHRFKFKWAPLLVILFLIFPAARIKLHTDRSDILNFFATPADPSLVNTLNTYAVLAAVIVPERLLHKTAITFQPYEIKTDPDITSPKTVVLVMGESMTPDHMSLFGYRRSNTPFLDRLAEDPNFVFKKGFSAATSTRSTFPMFFTIQYNPENTANMAHQEANLFRLAKRQGFRTFYISAQNSNCLNGIQTSAIDVRITYETETELFDSQKDDGLIVLARKLELGPRNFIVLHQRNIHAPYQYNYSHHPELEKYPVEGIPQREASVNAYDNAILYNDRVFEKIIEFFRQEISPPLYLWITSDHGEALGENGFWGHDKLDFEVATIPVMFYGTGDAAGYISGIRDMQHPTHYEMGKLIAKQLGCEIFNPNEEKDVFYIQGVVALGKGGYMKCRKSSDGITIQSEFVR